MSENFVKKNYNKYEYAWRNIRRSNDRNRFLSEKALLLMSNAVYKMSKSKKTIFYTHSYISKNFTGCKSYVQNHRILNQLLDIFEIKFKRSSFDIENKRKSFNRFELSLKKEAYRILKNPDEYYSKELCMNIDTQTKIEPVLIEFKNSYSTCMYKLLKQYQAKGIVVLTVDKIREFLGLKEKLKLYSDFKRYALFSSQKELNNNSDLFFNFEEIKESRKVIEIKFFISKNCYKERGVVV